MTHAEQIMTAVAHFTETQGCVEFSRDDVRRKIGVDTDTWLNGYTAIFQGMRIDQPGKAPAVGERFSGVICCVRHGYYVLTPKGKQLVLDFLGDDSIAAQRYPAIQTSRPQSTPQSLPAAKAHDVRLKIGRDMRIKTTIQNYHLPLREDQHHRYRSWEHCYSYFRETLPDKIGNYQDQAALQLGFYLASWGMYRGSSFLLRHAYTVHRGVIDLLAEDRFTPLWKYEFGTGNHDIKVIPLIMDAINGIKDAYKTFVPNQGSQQPTDTLVTKIILGTFGCLPACDRFFIDGFKKCGFPFPHLNRQFVHRISDFCAANFGELCAVQKEIQDITGFHYPMAKLVDMYFWQIGYDLDVQKAEQ